jgi:hypothetical protein
MTEPLRTDSIDSLSDTSGAERDARIEQLLLAGLDQYFAGQYDQAINVWTRVLFFDRGHARARAYIERARRAQAERQRESEELLHTGTLAYRSGDVREARRLLQAALDSGAPLELAFPMLDRLNQLEPMPAALAAARSARVVPAAPTLDLSSSPRRRALSPAIVIASALAVVGACLAAVLLIRSIWNAETAVSQAAPTAPFAPVVREAVLAVPTRGEMALARARQLAAGGSLHDALSALNLVRATDPQRPDADQLRTEIQQQLLRLEHP